MTVNTVPVEIRRLDLHVRILTAPRSRPVRWANFPGSIWTQQRINLTRSLESRWVTLAVRTLWFCGVSTTASQQWVYFQTNTPVQDELQNEARDLRKIQSGIESTINPQLVRSCFYRLLSLFSPRYCQFLNRRLLILSSGTHQLHHRKPAIHRGENERESKHPAATGVSQFPLFLWLILLLSGSSRKLGGMSWAKWEQHKTSSTQTWLWSWRSWVQSHKSHESGGGRKKSCPLLLIRVWVAQSFGCRGWGSLGGGCCLKLKVYACQFHKIYIICPWRNVDFCFFTCDFTRF